MLITPFNPIDSINESINQARKKLLLNLHAENTVLNGKYIIVKGKKVINFGSCSYLGLETDDRLKKAAIHSILHFGTQFSSSRTYLELPLYNELETLLNKIFNAPAVLFSSTSLGHKSVIPILVGDRDAAICDQYAHISMQEEVKKLQAAGTRVEILRHCHVNELEEKLKQLHSKHAKVWYFSDSVYSMLGDLAPIKELVILQKKYSSLHLYLDDAHGMSWTGVNGNGYVLSQTGLNQNMVLSTSLAKGFASAGGVFVFGNRSEYERVSAWGGALTYSGPQQPAVLGASIASAKIHLSSGITLIQMQLKGKIEYCNMLLKRSGIPIIKESMSPIFFIGTGTPKVAYNLMQRMLDEGFFLNLAVYPAVPETRCGLRFIITQHHQPADIDHLIKTLAFHYPKAMEEEGQSIRDVEKYFKLRIEGRSLRSTLPVDFSVQHERAVRNISREWWNEYVGKNGLLTWDNLILMEESFSNNPIEEENWDFHYFIVRDPVGKPVVVTFFTSAIAKEDMLLPASVSKTIEQLRRKNKYYLSPRCFVMGTLMTDGEHMYIDKGHERWANALTCLLNKVKEVQSKAGASMLLMRDFPERDVEIKSFFLQHGFVPAVMPPSLSINNEKRMTRSAFIQRLPSRRRHRLRKEVLEMEGLFSIEYSKEIPPGKISALFQLYKQVKDRSFEINNYALPEKLFYKINAASDWEKIIMRYKATGEVAAFVFAYDDPADAYHPLILGMDYRFKEHKIYKQILFQSVMRGFALNKSRIFLGLTATMEKRKLGAALNKNFVYIQSDDTLSSQVIDAIRLGRRYPDWAKVYC